MASTLTGSSAIAIHIHQAFFGTAPTATQLATYTTQATTDASGFASNMASSFVNTSSKALALQVLTNLNITSSTVTAGGAGPTGSYAILLSALEQMFDGYGLSARGQIILNATNLLVNLETDATYGLAALNYNTQATSFYAQSTGTAALSSSTPTATITGKLVDGYLSNATVFADANNNGKWDAGEATTTTDAQGNFSLSGGSGPLIGMGGTDLSTGLAFKGILKAPAGSTMINPLTSLQQAFVDKGLSVADAEAKVATALGLGDASTFDLTTFDPLAAALGGGADAALGATLQAAAVKLANFMVAAGETLIGAAGGAGNLPASTAGDALLAALVNAANAGGGVVNLNSTSTLKSILNDAALNSGDADLTSKASTVDAMSTAFANMSAAAADNVDAAVATGGAGLMTKLAQSAAVAQGDMADRLLVAAQGGSLDAIDQDFIGTAFNNAASQTIVPRLSYSATSFIEAAANDGSITTTSTLTLSNDTFTGSNGAALAGVSFANVPSGLTATLMRVDATHATLALTGNATAHANDIANLTVTLGNASFTSANAAAVTNATKSDLVVDFADPAAASSSAQSLDALAGTVDAPATFNAASTAFAFTDTVLTSSFTRISNFASNDSIAITNRGSTTVVFENTGSNVTITANDGVGHISQIVLVGVASASDMIGSLAAFNALPLGDVSVS